MVEITVFIYGLVVGSFINVCVHRLPRGESIILPRSHCPACHKTLAFYDNIPLVSFLLLKGRCRSCRVSIPWRYPFVELLHGMGALFVAGQFGLSTQFVVYFLFFASLMAVTLIDFSHQIVPDAITIPGMICGLVASSTVLPSGVVNALIGLFLGGGLFYLLAILSERFLKKEGMGGGDIKLIAMIGAFLGWQEMLLSMFLASLTGSVTGLLLILLRKKRREDPLPFGPFLALGALVALFFGDEILYRYFMLGRP